MLKIMFELSPIQQVHLRLEAIHKAREKRRRSLIILVHS